MGAVLVRERTNRYGTLGARTLVGRGPMCGLRLDDSRASAEHASIFWRSSSWCVRDLGSTNGTWLRSERLAAGEARPLLVGDRVFLGAADGPSIELVDAGPPIARAVEVSSGRTCVLENGLLHLPDAATPLLTIFHDRIWRAESMEGGSIRLHDLGVVDVGGSAWRLELPPVELAEHVVTTAAKRATEISLRRSLLHFRVSRDEEYVELHVVAAPHRVSLPPRVFHYMLLTLARQRLRDVAAGVPEADHGWIYADDLARQLATTKPKLNLDVCRARQQLADAGIDDAAQIIERRSTSQQLRIGSAALEIVTT